MGDRLAVEGSERVGLCAECLYADVVRALRGVEYWRCRRAETDPLFAKYPRLPVLECNGHERRTPPVPATNT